MKSRDGIMERIPRRQSQAVAVEQRGGVPGEGEWPGKHSQALAKRAKLKAVPGNRA
jgi:hypothetical protein